MESLLPIDYLWCPWLWCSKDGAVVLHEDSSVRCGFTQKSFSHPVPRSRPAQLTAKATPKPQPPLLEDKIGHAQIQSPFSHPSSPFVVQPHYDPQLFFLFLNTIIKIKVVGSLNSICRKHSGLLHSCRHVKKSCDTQASIYTWIFPYWHK